MSDLVGAIINQLETATDEDTVTLRGLCSNFVADFDPEQSTPVPYVVVSEDKIQPQELGFNFTYRLDRCYIDLAVYATTRQQAVTILDALENATIRNVPTTTNRVVLSRPELVGRTCFWLLDHWAGAVSLAYLTNKSPV